MRSRRGGRGSMGRVEQRGEGEDERDISIVLGRDRE